MAFELKKNSPGCNCCEACTCEININDVTVLEPGTGTTNAVFTVTISCPPGEAVTVEYSTEDGSATAGDDYEQTSGVLTFGVGVTTQKITVLVLADTIIECDETFMVNLENPSGDCIAGGPGIGTIKDCEFTIDDVTVCECINDEAVFTVTMDCPDGLGDPGERVIEYETSDGSATAGVDYTDTGGFLTFEAGETTAKITVPILNDADPEDDETFFVDLLGDCGDQGQGTIRDFKATINDVTVNEPDSGTVTATFTVTLLNCVPVDPITITWQTADGTATAPADYTATSGTLTFSAGQTVKSIQVSVNGDTTGEGNENFFVNLLDSSPEDCVDFQDDQGECTILDGCDTSINSSPDIFACVGELYTYQVIAVDGAGATLTYDLTTFPPGMIINEDTGLIEWTPGSTGSATVVIEVTGGCVSPLTQTYNLFIITC